MVRNGVEVASYRTLAGLRGRGTTGQPSAYGFTDGRVQPGERYVYTLRSVDGSGEVHAYGQTVEVTAVASSAPVAFALSQASPNPFNPATRLMLSLPEQAQVTATLYNALGQPVRTVQRGQMSAGTAALVVDAAGLATGAYLVRVVATGASGTHTSSQRVTLVK